MRYILIAMAGVVSMVGAGSLRAAEASRQSPLIIDVPDGQGPHPVAIYAPGGGGDARAAFPTALTKSLLERGVAVVRFDWSFRAAPGSTQARDLVSPGMAVEMADYAAALASVKGDARFRRGAILLMGKSLGTIVAARLLAAEPDIAGAVLMTPVCSRPFKPADPAWLREPYPTLIEEARPVALIGGEADPLCDPKALYGMAGRMRSRVRVVVVDGDHGFRVADDPSADARNFQLVGDASAAAAAAILRGRH